MELAIVVVGSFRQVEAQTSIVKGIAERHGFGGLHNGSMSRWGWIEEDSQAFICNHVRAAGFGDSVGFRREVLRLAGVYSKCPECAKRNVWRPVNEVWPAG